VSLPRLLFEYERRRLTRRPIALTVQGTAISLGSGATAAIDTGTTNIGGPSSAIQAIYAAIPGSSAATGEWAGYYQYRMFVPAPARARHSPPISCSLLDVSDGHVVVWRKHVDDEFGRLQVYIAQLERVYRCLFRDQFDDNDGFDALVDHRGCVPGESCIACVLLTLFAHDEPTQKNVYSVFRYNPPSVGFAALSEVAIAENGVNGAVPSATIGSVSATVTNTNGAAPRVRLGLGVVEGVVGLLVTMALWVL
jgi:hypothetical protein